MIECERSILRRLSRSQARMGRGSILCETDDCIKDITTGTQEHFVKLLPVNTALLQKIALSSYLFFFSNFFWNQDCAVIKFFFCIAYWVRVINNIKHLSLHASDFVRMFPSWVESAEV